MTGGPLYEVLGCEDEVGDSAKGLLDRREFSGELQVD